MLFEDDIYVILALRRPLVEIKYFVASKLLADAKPLSFVSSLRFALHSLCEKFYTKEVYLPKQIEI